MLEISATKLVAIVVTFNPEIASLCKLVTWLDSRVSDIIIVDNSSDNFSQWADFNYIISAKSATVLRQNTNLGIASAQNIGIQEAIRLQATHIVLFDQDSEPIGEMIQQLLSAHSNLEKQGLKVACVGPNYLDERRHNPPPFIRFEGLKLIRAQCTEAENVVAVDYLIASGSLVSIKAISIVGQMRSDLFIDYVDIEWGLRAKFFGLRSYGVCSAQMRHNLGDTPLKIFGKNYPSHSPLRHYYHFRNAVLLYKDPRFPTNWKVVDASRLFLKFFAYSLFLAPQFMQLKMMTLGLVHGISNRTGKY
jgi:rhamnosyltransferase